MHLVEDGADAGLELVDEASQLGFALLGRGSRSRGLFVAQAAAFDRVVLEDGQRSRDLADLVGALVAVDLDFGIAVGDRGQRGRDRGQRLGHAAHQHHGQQHHQQRGDAGRDGHVRDGVRQHGLELRHRNADVEQPITFPAGFMIG